MKNKITSKKLQSMIAESIKKAINENERIDKYGNPIPKHGQGWGNDTEDPSYRNRQGYNADGTKGPWFSRSVAVATAVILNDNGARYVLANQRGSGTPDYQGYWNLPCGYLDYNENGKEAAVREVFEETGIRLNPAQLMDFGYSSETKENRQNVCLFFVASINGSIQDYKFSKDNMEENEVDGIQWVPLDKTDDVMWAFDHDELIKKVIANFGEDNNDTKSLLTQAINILQTNGNVGDAINIIKQVIRLQ